MSEIGVLFILIAFCAGLAWLADMALNKRK